MSFGIFERLIVCLGLADSKDYRVTVHGDENQLVGAAYNDSIRFDKYLPNTLSDQVSERKFKAACDILLAKAYHADFDGLPIHMQFVNQNGMRRLLLCAPKVISSSEIVSGKILASIDQWGFKFAYNPASGEAIDAFEKLIMVAADRCRKRVALEDEDNWSAIIEAAKQFPTGREKETEQ